MPVTLGAKPLADFSQPLELMRDCHRRVEMFLDRMRAITLAAAEGKLDDSTRQALQTAVNYFRQAAPRHTQDEEESLFPRLQRCSDPRVAEISQCIDSLASDHQQANQMHAQVEETSARWLRQPLTPSEVMELRERIEQLQQHYAVHIRTEETQVFPLAAQILPKEELEEVGREMAQRRQLNPGREHSRCGARRRALKVAPAEEHR